jgi:uncharacterized membrane protein required for colicin V production
MQFLNDIQKVKFDWFDLVVLAAALLGLVRGRKRGMTEELLPLLQWLLIIILGAYTYAEFGRLFNKVAGLNLTFCNFAVYLFLAMVLKWVFTAVKNLLGDKLLVADAFGKSEFSLGMVAGILRYFCFVTLFVALLNGVYVSPAEQATAATRAPSSDTGFTLPSMASLQSRVFTRSVSGRFARTYLSNLLLKPVVPGAVPKKEGIGKRREGEVDQIVNPK